MWKKSKILLRPQNKFHLTFTHPHAQKSSKLFFLKLWQKSEILGFLVQKNQKLLTGAARSK